LPFGECVPDPEANDPKAAAQTAAPRRTQAERRAETRRRIIDAAAGCLAEDGAARTTMASISRRSGVTWGGIQHHFPTKADIHQAVVDDVLQQLREEVTARFDPSAGIEERVTGLVRAWWHMFRRPQFRAYLEIVLHTRGPEGPRYLVPHIQNILRGLWDDVFGDLELDPARRDLGLRLLFATMAGLVVDQIMLPDLPGRRFALERLAGSLTRILKGEADDGPGTFSEEDD
jgi:AcrR family transcriptional regulator